MAAPADDLTIRAMRADDDLDAELDLRHRSFGPMDAADRLHWLTELRACIDDSRQYGVWSAGTLVGAARFYDMTQWWRGRPVPMAGVGGVKVAPENRGFGVGGSLMRVLVTEMARRGYLVSVLYPATAQLYRSVGYELAGGRYIAEIPVRSLGALLPGDTEINGSDGLGTGRPELRRAGPRDAAALIGVLGAVHAAARHCGPSTRDVASARRWLASTDLFAYLADDGFLGYSWDGSDDEIKVHYLLAASPGSARALWGLIASHASVTKVVRAAVGPSEPVSWLTREPDVSVRRHKQWMLRVLDAAGAIAARGFPAGVRVSLPVLLADSQLPANAGPHTLTIDGGTGTLVPATERGAAATPVVRPLRLGPRGLAGLYAGVPMAVLRAAGLAAGGDPAGSGTGSDGALDDAFGCEPFMLDYF
jgi:predicted N-acetyltransferase YhbS